MGFARRVRAPALESGNLARVRSDSTEADWVKVDSVDHTDARNYSSFTYNPTNLAIA